MQLAKLEPVAPVESVPPRSASPTEPWLEFASYLVRTHALTGDLLGKFGGAGKSRRQKKLRDLWELTDLSANDFADAVARFFELPRVTLPQLLAATPLSTM